MYDEVIYRRRPATNSSFAQRYKQHVLEYVQESISEIMDPLLSHTTFEMPYNEPVCLSSGEESCLKHRAMNNEIESVVEPCPDSLYDMNPYHNVSTNIAMPDNHFVKNTANCIANVDTDNMSCNDEVEVTDHHTSNRTEDVCNVQPSTVEYLEHPYASIHQNKAELGFMSASINNRDTSSSRRKYQFNLYVTSMSHYF